MNLITTVITVGTVTTYNVLGFTYQGARAIVEYRLTVGDIVVSSALVLFATIKVATWISDVMSARN